MKNLILLLLVLIPLTSFSQDIIVHPSLKMNGVAISYDHMLSNDCCGCSGYMIRVTAKKYNGWSLNDPKITYMDTYSYFKLELLAVKKVGNFYFGVGSSLYNFKYPSLFVPFGMKYSILRFVFDANVGVESVTKVYNYNAPIMLRMDVGIGFKLKK